MIESKVENPGSDSKVNPVDLASFSIPREVIGIIPPSIARKHHLVPIKIENNILHVAMENTADFVAIDDVKMITGVDVLPVPASSDDIQYAINHLYGNVLAEKAIEDYKRENQLDNVIADIKAETDGIVGEAPIVRLTDSLIEQAIMDRASDIHIEPMKDMLRIRYRIDGQLQTVLNIPKVAHSAIITRIKILGNMNIAEKRLPQDGRYETTVLNREIDIRISSIPTIHGEKCVLRILDRSSFLFPKSSLGLTPENMVKFEHLLKNTHGIILVTGPTGSGKSTTLYTMLEEINTGHDNIVTIEDPVEYVIPGINQIQVNMKAGLDFAGGLRAVLRQDPDVIMVGEIRDPNTARVAIRAAITGHLVLSTIHTNDCASTVSRLLDMGVESYLLAASLTGLISQRLIRIICPNCKEEYSPTPFEVKSVGISTDYGGVFYKGKGCISCNHTGYYGRTAIHEIMVIDRVLRNMINNCASIESIRRYSRKQGTTSLMEECRKLVLKGTTSLEEAIRVAYSQDFS